MILNLLLSRRIGKKIGARDQECFRNSALGTVELGEAAVYVEGWVVTISGIGLPQPTEHAWVEHEGEIIDPTPVYHDGLSVRRYFPGERYTFRDVSKRIFRNQSLPFVGELGLAHSSEYRKAYLRACRVQFGDRWPAFAAQLKRDQWAEYPEVMAEPMDSQAA